LNGDQVNSNSGYILSGDPFKIQTSFGLFFATRYHQFSFKIFVRNHFSIE